MRILTGTMMHETNTFNTVPTTFEDFRPVYGQDLFNHTFYEDNSEATGGIMKVLRAEGVEIIPTLHVFPFVSGIIVDEAYQKAKEVILEAVRNAGELDGICFCLHGSMYTQAVEDPEGDLMSAIREIVGPDLPIVCALDMHATVTDELIRSVNALTVFRTAPHIDRFDTGVRAADLLLKIIRQKLKVVTVSAKLPMIIAGEHSMTTINPMKELIHQLYRKNHLIHVLNADYAVGFPWADTPHHSVRTIVSGEVQHVEELMEVALDLAQQFWDRRFEFTYSFEAYPLDEALDVALAEPQGPVIISDAGDNPTAGASSDNALVLHRLLERKIDNALIAVFADRSSYEKCREAGEGAVVNLQLGRKEPYVLEPYPVRGEVLAIKTGLSDPKRIRISSNAAIVKIEGVTVIIAEERMAVYDPGYLYKLELEPKDFQIIVIKNGYQSPPYQELASKSLFALTPGHTNITLTEIEYRKAPRPIYPLDEEAEWNADLDRESMKINLQLSQRYAIK
ncbi:M81 family metallopeptidase [Ammoniphilus sp. YIM 78166]|uniref:M81 family metallopeptidase n=1 Tax=Ammoniphilus sp. YIM 78166 TaxID=1644106 RepID=UPI0010705DD4|nr:M81 family metallopeptidase [Ammoniphilus sp. YIM 78166]